MKIALDNYNEERRAVPILPEMDSVPELYDFAVNGLGVAAFEDGAMVGYLCCYAPWDNAFASTAKGTFSPIHAHGAVSENRVQIYQKLYQAAARKWVENGITYHAAALYAHDGEAVKALFTYGFGLRCVDAVRPLEKLNVPMCEGVSFYEQDKADLAQIREMRRMLSAHLGESPCFMYSSEEDFQSWLARAEKRNSRIFVAGYEKKPIAYLEIAEGGAENFATESAEMKNICGAFCMPVLRGKGIFQGLLDYTIGTLKAEGYRCLGVDFESFNPTGNAFWNKYFTAYTSSLTRRIDECALKNYEN